MHGRLARAALVTLLLLALPATASAQVLHDNFDAAKPLYLGSADTADNAGATVQPGETLTARGNPQLTHCVVSGQQESQASRTLWWSVLGTGRPITVTTVFSTLDTHLGIFSGRFDGPVDACQDALGAETITFPSVAGRVYRIQVGSCASNAPSGCGIPVGTIRVQADSPAPVNDRRGAAAALRTDVPAQGDNYASTEEPGEPLACGAQPYGRTVWYRWTAPSNGRAQFHVTGANPSLALFTQGNRRLGCDTNPGPGASLIANVTRGDVLVQVGGLGLRNGAHSDSAQSPFELRVAFTPGRDRDGDGVPNERDCRPDDPRVYPGAKDRRGNGVDENCDGRDGYRRLRSRARLAVALFARYAKVRSLRARNVPAGARVQLRCSGRSCPFRRTRERTIRRKRASVSLMTAGLRTARLRPRTTLEVRVTSPEAIGSVTRYRFLRAGRPPAQQVRCLLPGSTSPRRC